MVAGWLVGSLCEQQTVKRRAVKLSLIIFDTDFPLWRLHDVKVMKFPKTLA